MSRYKYVACRAKRTMSRAGRDPGQTGRRRRGKPSSYLGYFCGEREREREGLVIRQGSAKPPCRNARMEEDGREFSLSTMIGRK